jgi:EAL domain-containing protein (putative c-di-GMP-specific phosphodiesterase class I)
MAGHDMRAYLEHYPEQGGPVESVEIANSPFLIGRSRSAKLTIYSKKVSHQHAQISDECGEYLICDLGSTNGTFVNGQRIEEARLHDGDIIHVAHWEFCFSRQPGAESLPCNTAEITQQSQLREIESLIRTGGFLRQMITDRSVFILFQGIFDLTTGEIIGYEALGRGKHHHLHHSPGKLFQLAEKCQMERELCRLFRSEALKAGESLPAGTRLFLNIHPSEFAQSDFLASLAELSRVNRNRHPLVIEISERFVTDLDQMRLIKRTLSELSMEFAYDDFGAGQGRLLELAECPPHYLKLDLGLVQQMGTSAFSRDLVKAFLSAIADKGVPVIAEGIETEHMAEVSRECGCNLGQGFLYGRPTSALHLFPAADDLYDSLGPR